MLNFSNTSTIYVSQKSGKDYYSGFAPSANQLGDGPLNYTADLLGSKEEALLFYGPMHLLYSVYDNTEDKASVLKCLDEQLERWNQ